MWRVAHGVEDRSNKFYHLWYTRFYSVFIIFGFTCWLMEMNAWMNVANFTHWCCGVSGLVVSGKNWYSFIVSEHVTKLEEQTVDNCENLLEPLKKESLGNLCAVILNFFFSCEGTWNQWAITRTLLDERGWKSIRSKETPSQKVTLNKSPLIQNRCSYVEPLHHPFQDHEKNAEQLLLYYYKTPFILNESLIMFAQRNPDRILVLAVTMSWITLHYASLADLLHSYVSYQ